VVYKIANYNNYLNASRGFYRQL